MVLVNYYRFITIFLPFSNPEETKLHYNPRHPSVINVNLLIRSKVKENYDMKISVQYGNSGAKQVRIDLSRRTLIILQKLNIKNNYLVENGRNWMVEPHIDTQANTEGGA